MRSPGLFNQVGGWACDVIAQDSGDNSKQELFRSFTVSMQYPTKFEKFSLQTIPNEND